MEKPISNELTYIYKYVLPPLYLSGLIFMFYISIYHKIYLFIGIVLIFGVLSYFAMKKIFSLKKVWLTDGGIILKTPKEGEEISWKDIEKVNRIRGSFFVRIKFFEKDTIYYIPKLSDVFSRHLGQKYIDYINSQVAKN